MIAFFATFKLGFKYLWRNPVNVAILIVFPIVIIFILGNALSSYISIDLDLDVAPVAVVAAQDSPIVSFLESDEISRFLSIQYADMDRAIELVEAGSVVAAVVDEGGRLSTICPPGAGMYTKLALSIIDSYKQIGAAATIAAMSGRDVYALLEIQPEVNDVPLGKRIPNSIDYYAVTMLVMILLYTGMNGMEFFNKGLLSDIGRRARIAPISKSALIGGLLAASSITSFLQGMVTFLFTGIVYGVYWGERIPLVLLTLFAVVLFSQSLCIFLIIAVKHEGAVAGITQAAFFIMTFVSKGYMKMSFGAADKVFQYMPNAMAHTIIFGAVFGGNEAKMMLCLIALFGISAILFIGAYIFGRRRLA